MQPKPHNTSDTGEAIQELGMPSIGSKDLREQLDLIAFLDESSEEIDSENETIISSPSTLQEYVNSTQFSDDYNQQLLSIASSDPKLYLQADQAINILKERGYSNIQRKTYGDFSYVTALTPDNELSISFSPMNLTNGSDFRTISEDTIGASQIHDNYEILTKELDAHLSRGGLNEIFITGYSLGAVNCYSLAGKLFEDPRYSDYIKISATLFSPPGIQEEEALALSNNNNFTSRTFTSKGDLTFSGYFPHSDRNKIFVFSTNSDNFYDSHNYNSITNIALNFPETGETLTTLRLGQKRNVKVDIKSMEMLEPNDSAIHSQNLNLFRLRKSSIAEPFINLGGLYLDIF